MPAIVLVPIIGKQKFLLYYMLLMLPVRLIPIWWVGYVTHNAALSVAVFCGVNAISNFILIAYVFVMTKKNGSRNNCFIQGEIMIYRIVGMNLSGGARRYCYILNDELKKKKISYKNIYS